MILALALFVLGATNAMGQKTYQAELDRSMFKAWDSHLAGANEVANPDPEPKNNGTFGCEINLYTEVGAYGTIYGSSSVYYLWYADITGTKTLTVTGTPGMQIRVMLNRGPFLDDGVGDADGGAYVELIQTIGDDGTTVFDFTAQASLGDYIHLNAIKVPNGSPAGVVTALVLDGTVRPVSGYLDLISNGDAEGSDLNSFPLSLHAFDGDDSRADFFPEIVDGGVNGSKCFKVTSDDNAPMTWTTQQFIKFDEPLQAGDKWKLSMYIRADRNQSISSSAQGQPRSWHSGFIDEFGVTTEWKEYTFSGEVTEAQAGSDGFLSIALDLNVDQETANTFYFDNIKMQKDLGGSNPMSDVSIEYGSDVICVGLGDNTNMKDLVKAAGGKTLIYDNSCATATWNGKECNIVSVEGRPDGNLYVFLLDMDGEGGMDFDAEDADVKVGFTNPADDAHHLSFVGGKWAGQAVPDFSGLACKFNFDLGAGDIYSYLWGSPALETIEPENGSFNLPADMKEFKVTFNQGVEAASIVARLDREALTVSPAEGVSKQFTLTRTGEGALEGVKQLVISAATGEKGMPLEEAIVLKYSFGLTQTTGEDQPEVLLTDNFGADDKNNYVPAGWILNSDAEERGEGDYGAGCRVIVGGGGDNGFTKAIMYICSRGVSAGVEEPGHAYYGTVEGHSLFLTAREYTLSADAATWDAEGTQRKMKMAVCNEAGEVIKEMTQEVVPSYKLSKEFTHFEFTFTIETEGNYILKFIPLNMSDAAGGYGDACAVGNIKLEYIPDVMGLVEMKALANALERAKATRESNSDSRYDGAAFTALDNKIKEYDGKTMTAPSAYDKAVEELDAAIKVMNNHRALCDGYDPLPQKALDIVNQFAGSKFDGTEAYATLTSVVNKYGVTEAGTTIDDVTGEEIPALVLTSVKELKDDAELATATEELTAAINNGNGMFTTGPSKAMTTGTAALTERIRRGAETLKTLGVADNDPLIAEADKALTDDSALANRIKTRVIKELYGQLKNADNKLFEPTEDPTTGENVTPELDMTVFIKNPNFYITSLDTHSFSSENIPGWSFTTESNAYLDASWSGIGTYAPVDVTLCNWNGSFNGSQTIENLPAGVYSLKSGFMERAGDDETAMTADSYIFARTSTNYIADDPALPGDTAHVKTFGSQDWNLTDNLVVEGIVVTDGKLTIGMNAASQSHLFVNQISLWMTSPVTGFDYAKALDDYIAAIRSLDDSESASVRAIQLFDLNGRRLTKAQKGITIVRKLMSDGSVKTEKIVIK